MILKKTAKVISFFLLISFNAQVSSEIVTLHALEDRPFNINGRLKVVGTQIQNQYDKAIQLRGMSTHGLQYRGNCYSDVSLELLANEWGADILRISMYIQEGGYETNPAYFTAFVDRLVDNCYDMGIYALIDWHMLHPGDPNANTALAKVFFEHVSKKHANKGNVLYEICNEPNNDNYVVTWPMIKSYAEQIIPIIRNNDPNSIIIVGTTEFASRPDLVIGNELNYDNIMYTMHFYAADSGQIQRMGYVSTALENGIPVFVTEFGTQDGWGDGANNFEMSTTWLQFLAERKISWCNWNYSDSPRSGATWKTGTCPNGPWTDNNLKEAGLWIRERLRSPADDWSGNYPRCLYNFNTGAESAAELNPTSLLVVSESKKDSPGFLPLPASGAARVMIGAGAGAGFVLNNSMLQFGASNNNLPNKFSLYDVESSSLTCISFKIAFNNCSQGTAVLAIGNSLADIFKNSSAYSNNKQEGLFSAIHFTIDDNSINPQHRIYTGFGYSHRAYDTNLFTKSEFINVEMYCNNTTKPVTYIKNHTTYTLPAGNLHVFINDVRLTTYNSANLSSSREASSYLPINAFMLSGYDSTSNTLFISISDLKFQSLTHKY